MEERISGTTSDTIRYYHGAGIDEPLARENSSDIVTYYLADHLGSIVQETSNAGAATLEREYDPWGILIQASGASGYAFTGREWDSEIGLYFYRARYYDPTISRFTGRDAILGTGSLYSYVVNTPLTLVDPSGNIPLLLLLPTVGGLISGGVSAASQAASGAGARDIASGFLAGFASGFIGTAAAIGTAAVPGVGAVTAGAVGGLVASLTQGYVSRLPMSAVDVAAGVVTGALGAGGAAAVLPTKGRLPDLFTPRSLSNFGKNSQRLVGQEGIAGAVGGAGGAAVGMFAGQGTQKCSK